MKIKIKQDELYPWYIVDGDYGYEVDIPEDVVKAYIKAQTVYNKAWRKLHDAVRKYHENH